MGLCVMVEYGMDDDFSGVFFYLQTNNATKSRKELVKKLAKFGIRAEPENVITAASSTVHYLVNKGFSKKVYMVGEVGLRDELELAGIEAYGLEHSDMKYTSGCIKPEDIDPDVGAVVVGMDT